MLKQLIKNKKKAQSLIEYIILVTIVLAVFLGMGQYLKRAIQGRWKASLDEVGEQYDPRFHDEDIEYRMNSEVITQIITQDVPGGKWTYRADVSNSIETRTGISTILEGY
ncbi:MAG: hypothetical protein KC713_06680 [Candidatus Omnitrophica bacterium]|nr:hypothetical protein [Candidatus Omnitrophota bacterium]